MGTPQPLRQGFFPQDVGEDEVQTDFTTYKLSDLG